MTITPTEPDPKPAKPEPYTGPTVRSVVYGGLAACAVAGAAAAFALGGWIGVAVFGGAALIAPAAARRAVKGPARRGPLHDLLKATKRTKSTGGTLTWPFTGNQSNRAKTRRSGAAGSTGKSPGRSTSLSGRSSGRRGGGSTNGKKSSPLSGLSRGSKSPQGSRSISTAPKLGTARRAHRAATAAGRPMSIRSNAARPVPKTGTPGPRARTVTTRKPVPAPGSRPKVSRTATRGKLAPRLGGSASPARRVSAKRSPSPRMGTKRPVSRSTPRPGTGSQRRPTLGQRFNPLGGASRLGTRGRARSARRLGTPKAPGRNQRTGVPNRRTTRPHTPTRPGTYRRMLRTSLGVPKRHPGTVVPRRPAAAARKRARRALLRATATGGRRQLARFGSWNWQNMRRYFTHLDQRARGLTAPMPLPPGTIAIPVTPPEDEAAIRRKYTEQRPRTRRHRAPYPKLTQRRTTAATSPGGKMHALTESITEAYAQLGQFDPNNATEILDLLESLPDMHTDSAASLTSLAQRMSSEQPLHAPVIDALTQLASMHAGLADMAAEAWEVTKSQHADDIARLQGDRGLANERAWDVSANG